MLLKIRFHCKRCRHGSRTEQVVAAAMSVRVLPFGFLSHRAAAFLGQLRQGVILGEETDHRLFCSICSFKCRRHAADSHFHLESFFFQNILVEFCGLKFMKSCLRIIKNFVTHLDDQVFFVRNCF